MPLEPPDAGLIRATLCACEMMFLKSSTERNAGGVVPTFTATPMATLANAMTLLRSTTPDAANVFKAAGGRTNTSKDSPAATRLEIAPAVSF